MGVNVDVSAVWFVVDQHKLRPEKVDGVCRRYFSVEGYFLPDLETMPIESEYVGKVKVLEVMLIFLVDGKFGRVETHRAVVTNCGDVLCVQRQAYIVWGATTRRDLVRDPRGR